MSRWVALRIYVNLLCDKVWGMRKLYTENGEDGDTPILWNAVVDTWEGVIYGDSQVMK
jgi:hypothetical protein